MSGRSCGSAIRSASSAWVGARALAQPGGGDSQQEQGAQVLRELGIADVLGPLDAGALRALAVRTAAEPEEARAVTRQELLDPALLGPQRAAVVVVGHGAIIAEPRPGCQPAQAAGRARPPRPCGATTPSRGAARTTV